MSSDYTRWTVIRRAAQGIPEDQAEFVGRYGPVIRAYLGARWRHTPLFDEVEDAAQHVFMDCFKENGALGGADPDRGPGFRAYLFGVVRNVARDTERKRARSRERQPTSSIDLATLASTEESCATTFDREWARGILREAAELQLARARENGPDAVRRHNLLALRYGQDLPIREIATRWDVDPARLHREYPKAREEFKRALMDVVRDLQGGDRRAVEAECARLLDPFS